MEANSNKPKRRMQFTLLNLLLLMTTVAVCFGLYRARLDNEILDQKNQELVAVNESLVQKNEWLNAERGGLTIEDKTKAYAIRVPEIRDNVWTYRVHLPEDDEYFVAAVVNNLPTGDYGAMQLEGDPPNTSTIKSIRVDNAWGVASGMPADEYLISFALFEKEGKWHYRLKTYRVSEGIQGGKTIGSEIRAKEDEWPLSSEYLATSASGVAQKQQPTDLKEPLVLLDYRRNKSGVSSDSSCGAIVWIDRISDYEE